MAFPEVPYLKIGPGPLRRRRGYQRDFSSGSAAARNIGRKVGRQISQEFYRI